MNIAIPNVREGLFAQFYDISELEMTTNFTDFSFKSKLSHLDGQNQEK